MKTKLQTVARTILAAGCLASIGLAAGSQPTWQTITVPGLPTGSQLGAVWARSRGEAYVWASRVVANYPQSMLFRWDGISWSQILALTNYSPGRIFGTGVSDVFASANYQPNGANSSQFALIFRSTDAGASWIEQLLPSAVTNASLGLGHFGGTEDNVHVALEAGITRFDGTNWNLIFTEPVRGIYGLTLVSPTEGYYVTCLAWGTWDGTIWRGPISDPNIGCDVYGGVWGMRDPQGRLSLYAVGQNNFNNGVRVWSFNDTNQVWSLVLSDGPGGSGTGNGIGVWGTAADDIYVIGELISGTTHSGRVYHFDGVSWTRITEIGEIPQPTGLSGTAKDDVWVSLGLNGALLHYTPPLLIDRYAGLTISGQVGAMFQVQYTASLNSSNWVTLTNLTLPTNPYLFFDTSPARKPGRFYRVVPVP